MPQWQDRRLAARVRVWLRDGSVTESDDVDVLASRLGASFPEFARLPARSKRFAAERALTTAAAALARAEEPRQKQRGEQEDEVANEAEAGGQQQPQQQWETTGAREQASETASNSGRASSPGGACTERNGCVMATRGAASNGAGDRGNERMDGAGDAEHRAVFAARDDATAAAAAAADSDAIGEVGVWRKGQNGAAAGPATPTPRKTKRRRAPSAATLARAHGGAHDEREQPAPSFIVPRPSQRYADVGGIESIMLQVRELVEWPLMHVELYEHLGVEPPRGILLHGPPGCGKTLLANAIAGELGVPLLRVAAPEIVAGLSGESEQRLRALFAEARAAAPCIVFMDEIDAITSKRDSSGRDMLRRIVAQLLTCMDSIALERTGRRPVMVIGATNQPDALDSALRRAGRFDRELEMGAPDEAARARILATLARKLRLAGDFDFGSIAQRTAGYVGADLAALTTEAAAVAVGRIGHKLFVSGGDERRDPPHDAVPAMNNAVATGDDAARFAPAAGAHDDSTTAADDAARFVSTVAISDSITTTNDAARFAPAASVGGDVSSSGGADTRCCRNYATTALSDTQLAPLSISMQDFVRALGRVQPSALREGFTTVPDVTWADIGALDTTRSELQMAVVEPVRDPARFARFGLAAPAGVLLYGPPGCGKTLLAKAVASESGANFISVKGPELLNKYVGESERAVRRVFQRARSSSPCVVFFDELDALAARRAQGDGSGSSSQASERVVNQLLTELDGMDARRQVFVVAATNRPDLIDAAMLRPGRLDKLLYVPLPERDGREAILRAAMRGVPVAADVDAAHVAHDARCDGFSGADLAALVREAATLALRANESRIGMQHFDEALHKVTPSVSKRDAVQYRARAHGASRR